MLVLSAAIWAPDRSQAQNASTEAPSSGARRVRIAASGDVLLHQKVVSAAETHGWPTVFSALGDLLSEEEIAFVNLETPLTMERRPPATGSPPILGAPPSAAEGLAAVGVDVAGCANNHSHDQNAIGMLDTVQALDAAGIVAVGAAAEEADAYGHRIVERDGVRVAFLSYTERINRGPGGRPVPAVVATLRQEERLLSAIAEARRAADVVVLGVHWSHDFHDHPHAGQRRRARAWVEAGVDVILGSGPHVLQEVERLSSSRGDAIVAYSLGNFVSNQGQRWRARGRVPPNAHIALRLPETRDGLLLRLGIEIENGRLAIEATGVALWTENNFFVWAADQRRRRRERTVAHDIRVVPMSQASEAVQQRRHSEIAETIGDVVQLQPLDDTSEQSSVVNDPQRGETRQP